MSDHTSLGDRMKQYEEPSINRRAFKGQPLIARLDGNNFHTFTKGLKRPYDERLSELMIGLTEALVDRYSAVIGYTQSDEITLAWFTPTGLTTGDYPFSGRFQKLESLLAGFASAWFTSKLREGTIPEKTDQLVCFDCRAFVVPNRREAYHTFLWRQLDATKNAISMAAQAHFSHKTLQHLHGGQMKNLLLSEKGINFDEYPSFFRRGTFVRRARDERILTPEQLARIPEKYRPTGPVTRSFIDRMDIDMLAYDITEVNKLFSADERLLQSGG